MKKTINLFLIGTIFFAGATFAQFDHPNFLNSGDVFGTRVFIENRGQFDKDVVSDEKVYYALIRDQEKIYFTPKGVIYVMAKTFPLTERQQEAREKGEHIFTREPEIHYVKMNWLNSNANVQLVSSEKQSHYFTYWTADLKSNTYKKITYKNVYNHIDIEYVIPEDKEQGVKYTVILHPGANINDVRMEYSGEIEKIKVNRDGNVIIKTPLDDLIEHKPYSFYDDKNEVASQFKVENNVLSFECPKGYELTRTLHIDPWVTAVTTLSTNNMAYDVDYDDQGNVFVYGGTQSCKIAKFSPAGVLLWTWAGTLTTPSWNSAGISNFVVMRSSGKSYAGQGVQSGGARIIRLDANGVYDNLITPAANTWNEVWDLAYHCSTGNVYGMGGSTTSNQSAGILNQITGNLVPIHFIGLYNTTYKGNDVVNHAIDDAGDFFWIYASNFTPTLSNMMAKINSAFTSTVWVMPSGYTTLTEYGNKSAYIPNPGASNGYNCLAVNASYLFYYDGKNIAAYNKTTGVQIASSVISAHVLKRQGGIAVDDCNNLYLGGNDTIKSFNFNGTTFAPLPNILIGVTGTTNAAVYDLKMNRFTKTLYASGKGFVGVYGASNSSTCAPLNIICYNPNPQELIICAGSSITLTPVNFMSLVSPTFAVQPGAFSNTTGTFVLTPLTNVNYTTYVTGTTTNNVAMTLTSVVNVTVNPQPVTAPTTTQTTCTGTLNGFNLNLSFNPPGPVPGYTITWSTIPNGVFTFTQTNASGAITPGVYTATITTATGCSTVTSFTIDPQPEPSIFTKSPSAGSYQIDCYQPILTLTYTPATYNYTSTNGVSLPLVGPIAVFSSTNSFGSWTVTGVNPTSGCISKQVFVIVTNTAIPTSTLTPLLQNINCSVTTVTGFTAIANPTVNITHQWMSPLGGTVTMNVNPAVLIPGGPGNYTHCVVNDNNGCSTCKTMTVFSSSGYPTFSVVSAQDFTLGCGTKSVATLNITNGATSPVPGGPISYTIIGPATSTNYVTGSQSTYTVNTPGTWTVITKDNTSFCETKVQVSVLQNTFAPDISAIVPYQVLTCDQPSVILQGVSTTPNIAYNWSFPGVPGNFPSSTVAINANFSNTTNTVVATYTLMITDNSSTCKSTTVVTMLQNIIPPTALISGGTQLTCNTPSINFTNSSSTRIPPYFSPTAPVIGYMWSGPSPQIPLQVSSTYIGWAPGNYTMVAKDLNNGCMAVATKSLDDFRDYPIVNNPIVPPPAVLDCGAKTATLIPIITTPTAGLTYTWSGPPTASMSDQYVMIQYPNEIGQYQITVYNPANGCSTDAVMTVVNGTLKADFAVDQSEGYAPLEVLFTNKSSSTNGTNNITSIWSFGNGTSQITYSTTASPQSVYRQPGTYTVTMNAVKGSCMDTVQKIIQVGIASTLEIPNVFSPNNDNVNDVFFVKATNLIEITIIIIDRWGHKVYELTSTSGNIAWDGKNQTGQEVAEGVYSYVLTAKGKDGVEFNKNGTITLLR
ncbi:MAG: gliding motility-associated C-terminal domain-containing protein [bacterium]|nr:gliding motility-associated C-terminal domain-containing protein [bacterium]